MADILCGYTADRDETLTAYLYGDIEPAQRTAFEAHIATCERCRHELSDLEQVRERLQEWTPPETARTLGLGSIVAVSSRDSTGGRVTWVGWEVLRGIPAWAQVAAAFLFLGISAGIANLDIRYDGHGVSIHTGWSRPSTSVLDAEALRRDAVAASAVSMPWRKDLDELERRLKTEWHSSAPVTAAAATPASAGSNPDAELLRQVRALIGASERKQQNDLALRIAEVVRDFDARRGADLVTIYGGLGAIQTNTRFEVAKQRQWVTDYLTQVSSRK
jgi:anti-sigma factor RsiW